MVIAVAVSYLMFFRVIASTLLLNMLAIFCSLSGSIIGMYGAFLIYNDRRRDRMKRDGR
jgi:membrane associated rhomboid family serine protease